MVSLRNHFYTFMILHPVWDVLGGKEKDNSYFLSAARKPIVISVKFTARSVTIRMHRCPVGLVKFQH